MHQRHIILGGGFKSETSHDIFEKIISLENLFLSWKEFRKGKSKKDELDQLIKHKLKIKYYLWYCDDFLILGEDRKYLTSLINPISQFLNQSLKLNLHPDKIEIRKYRQGIDFLGYVALPHYRVLRTKTKKRVLRKMKQKCQDLKNNLISKESFNQSLQSYLGVLKHCKGRKVKKKLMDLLEKN